MTTAPVLSAHRLSRSYEVRRSFWTAPEPLHALSDASFALGAGETLAVVGESGCGKSTLARVATMIEPPTDGRLEINGEPIIGVPARALRRTVQMVFQDPYGSLNPRRTIGATLEEPLLVNFAGTRAERRAAALAMMEKVGLRPEAYDRYPHMFSGGQRQRIAIARALMLNPKILVLDEPVSALDVSIQAQVLNLLMDLKDEFDLAYLFISHDLAVVRHIADEVMVMYLGRIVEKGPKKAIFAAPRHPYTEALLSATPSTEASERRTRIRLSGELPSPLNPPTGCAFHPRCPKAIGACAVTSPALERKGDTFVACIRADEIAPSQAQ